MDIFLTSGSHLCILKMFREMDINGSRTLSDFGSKVTRILQGEGGGAVVFSFTAVLRCLLEV